MAIEYEHSCRDCKLTWVETYNLSDLPPDKCPLCHSENVYRHVGSSGFTLKGAGWSSDGYYKLGAYDQMKKQGLKVKRYDNKEDHDRELKGEAEAAEWKKQRKLDRISKKTLGNRAGVTMDEAEKKVKKAGKDALPTTD